MIQLFAYLFGVIIGTVVIVACIILVLTLNRHADKIDLLSFQIENSDNKLKGLINALPVKLVKAERDIIDDRVRWNYFYEYVSLEESEESEESDSASDISKADEDGTESIYATPEFQAYLESLEMISKDTLISYVGLSNYNYMTTIGMIKLPTTRWDDIVKGYEEYTSKCDP